MTERISGFYRYISIKKKKIIEIHREFKLWHFIVKSHPSKTVISKSAFYDTKSAALKTAEKEFGKLELYSDYLYRLRKKNEKKA